MSKVPIHVWSGDGSSLPLALKLKGEGHPVTWHVHSKAANFIGRGLLPNVAQPPTGALVIFDCTGKGTVGDRYRALGHAVIGGNTMEKELELDRPRGAKLAASVGMRVPPTFPFQDIPTALQFLGNLTTDAAWFVKVSGDQVESSTHDAPDAESMIRYLEWIQESRGKVDPFTLQQTVEGTEVSCNGWFDGQRFVPPYDITFESKHFLTGRKGPRTGCESCLVYHAQSDALAKRTILPCEDALRAGGYVGPVDVNALVDDRGRPQFLEFTARLGFDSTQAWMRLFDDDLGEQLDAFAHGELDRWEPTWSGLSGTLRLSIPPYPVWDEALVGKTRGLPLDYDLLGDPFVDPIDVQEGPAAAGGSGIVCTVGAVGKTVDELVGPLLERAEDLEIPQVQYRVDPLDGVQPRLDALKKLSLSGYSA